jgi:hypothetical protein
LVPTLVQGGHSFLTIAVPASSDGATCGINALGTPLCWGRNQYGNVGDGTVAKRLSPVPVLPPE